MTTKIVYDYARVIIFCSFINCYSKKMESIFIATKCALLAVYLASRLLVSALNFERKKTEKMTFIQVEWVFPEETDFNGKNELWFMPLPFVISVGGIRRLWIVTHQVVLDAGNSKSFEENECLRNKVDKH